MVFPVWALPVEPKYCYKTQAFTVRRFYVKQASRHKACAGRVSGKDMTKYVGRGVLRAE